MNRIQQAIMKMYRLEVGQEFYILFNKPSDECKIGKRVSNHKYHFDESGEVVNERGQRKISILGGLVSERFAIEKDEHIKLSSIEYDLINQYVDIFSLSSFDYWDMLNKLKKRGHFKGVKDTSMKLRYILENCEVVDD